MVNNEGQLYTIEGVAAAILMVVTVYIILNSTFILTPGDTHINDMQLEQLGNDVLKIMDTRPSFNGSSSTIYGQKESMLEQYVSGKISDDFRKKFRLYTNNETNLDLNAYVYYVNDTGMVQDSPFTLYQSSNSTGTEHMVKVTKWVNLDGPNPYFSNPRPGPQTVLLEVS